MPERGQGDRASSSGFSSEARTVMNHNLLVEVCVDAVDSALAAERGGAQRVELCSSLVEGGVTPSAGLIATAHQKISIDLHVMIRPRPGDFYYSADEFAAMQRDVLMAKQLAADGVVFGLLGEDGKIDILRTRQLVDLARPLKTTFHRAFDMSVDRCQSVEHVVETGADRILTSGGARTALEGAATLRSLVETAAGRVIIMACGGIDDQNVKALVEKTGVREIHVGLRTSVASPMRYRNENISMGTVEGSEYQRFIVLEDRVERLLRAARACGPGTG
jgi:copper homeostasis protein